MGLFYAASPYALWIGRMARPYGFLFLALAILWVSYLSALRRGDRWGWIRYGAAVCLATLCHLNTVHLVAGLLLAGLWLDRAGTWGSPNRLGQAAAAVLGCLPAGLWLLTRTAFLGDVLDAESHLPPLEFVKLQTHALLGLFKRTAPAWPAVPLLALTLFGLRRLLRDRRETALRLLSVCAVCSLVTALTLGSKAAFGVEWTRYLLPMLYPTLGFLAYGVVSLPGRALTPIAAVAVLATFAVGSHRLLGDKMTRGRNSYELAARKWVENFSPDGVLALGRDAVRLSHSLARVVPPDLPLFSRHPDMALRRMPERKADGG